MLTERHRKMLLEEEGVEAWTFEQHVGEAVVSRVGRQRLPNQTVCRGGSGELCWESHGDHSSPAPHTARFPFAQIIPSGTPHQVRNLRSCLKVAVDFVAAEGVNYALKLSSDLREMSLRELRDYGE